MSSGGSWRSAVRATRKDPGTPDPVPLKEDAPLREKLYPYGTEEYEKILVERVVMGGLELPGTVLRLPAVYGPGDYQHRLFPYLKRMDEGRAGILLGEGMASWRWTHGYVEDVAAAITLAVVDERAAGRIYNVGEPAPLTWAEWVREIGRVVGWNGEIVPMPKDRLPKHLGPGPRHGPAPLRGHEPYPEGVGIRRGGIPERGAPADRGVGAGASARRSRSRILRLRCRGRRARRPGPVARCGVRRADRHGRRRERSGGEYPPAPLSLPFY